MTRDMGTICKVLERKTGRGRRLDRNSSKFCKQVRTGAESNRSHRYELLNGEVVTEGSVSSVTPGPFVNRHAVFPFVFEQVSR